MILVSKIINSVLDENCYIVHNKNRQAIVIDPGSDFDKIKDFINKNKLDVQAVLLTHGHFDHTYSCRNLQNFGYKIYVHHFDKNMCIDKKSSLAWMCGLDYLTFEPDVLLFNDNELKIGDFNVKVINAPGHSRGGVAYIIENNLFSGDTLFFNGYGRTDFDGGDEKQILSSVKTLMTYVKGGYKLYPGHDY